MEKRNNLFRWILTALVAGIITGGVLSFFEGNTVIENVLLDGVFEVGAQIFLNMFRFIVVPVVFVSLLNGILSMDNPLILGRIGLKTLLIYIGTTAIAVVIGLVTAYMIAPGKGVAFEKMVAADSSDNAKISLVDLLTNIVPDNFLEPFTSGNMLQVIFLAVFGGVALVSIRSQVPMMVKFLKELDQLNLKLIKLILCYAPIGVFCLLADMFATLGWEAIVPLSKYILAILVAYTIHILVVDWPLLRLGSGVPFWPFLKRISPVIVIAMSSTSSNATLPVNIETSIKKIGVPESIATFTLSLGSTINMNGTAIMQGVAVVFIAQLYDINLSLMQLLTIVLTVLIASVGTAGMPSAGVLMLGITLSTTGLPSEGIMLIMGVDRIVDMARTVLNVTGDTICAAVVAKSEKLLQWPQNIDEETV